MYQSKTKGSIQKIRDSRIFKGLAVYLAFSILFEIIHPNFSFALTEGPSQPEVQSFEPVGTTQMVDPFTGDFNYNIPLFNLPGPNGGYPVNLAYHAGVTMDDEASWVGLGWNINAGSLVRNVRGLPDEFKSSDDDGDTDHEEPEDHDGIASAGNDYLEVQSDMKESWTLGVRGRQKLEAFGVDDELWTAGISASASIYYNNYNGVGVSLGADAGINNYLGVGLSLDSENGLGVSASLNFQTKMKKITQDHSLTLNFDGNMSLDYGLMASKKYLAAKTKSKDSSGSRVRTKSHNYGSSIAFARSAFTPSVNSRYTGYNFSAGITGGAEAIGFFAGGSVSLFYNTQDYAREDKQGRKRLVAGYARVGESDVTSEFTRDFSRSNDGQITKSSMFLPVSNFTYDVYNSTGQGLSGYFRPRRSDIGRSYDPFVKNVTLGGSASFEIGAGSTAKAGYDLGINFGWSTQGPWDEENDLKNEFWHPGELQSNVENVYYQAHGEMTVLDLEEMEHIGGLGLPFVRLTPKSEDGLAGGKRNINNTSIPNLDYESFRKPDSRVVRNTMIHTLRNEEVKNLGEYKVEYFSSALDVYDEPSNTLTRDFRKGVNIGKHYAGYKVLNSEGSYYVYALPAYNNKEVENMFSVGTPSNPAQQSTVDIVSKSSKTEVNYTVGGTHKFINKTTKSPYAHSFLLTSVQGADYVDITNNGPTDDDLGYWVKFNYVKYSGPEHDYQWRTPYEKASYSRGAVYSSDDDKGSYHYGEKEVWYLGRMETKTHVAVFKMSVREDMQEAKYEVEKVTSDGLSGLKLDEINVYEKQSFLMDHESAVPLQTIHFEYAYELTAKTPNSNAANPDPLKEKGKLTLKKVWFTSNGSSRGDLSSYKFDYGTAEFNPNYQENAYDAWGNYRPVGDSYEHSSHFPYVNQFNQEWNDGLSSETCWQPDYTGTFEDDASREITKETQDKLVSAWCLKEITLPSGGTIDIEYESDDYGYVQHKTAAQMFRITKLGDDMNEDEIYDLEAGFDDEENRRIYFKLEYPLAEEGVNHAEEVYKNYVAPLIEDEDHQRNLFIKAKTLLKITDGQPVYDYISAYYPLEAYSDTRYGVRASSLTGGYYTEGFVTIKRTRKKKKNSGVVVYYDQYHPMALAAWTYMQTDAQELLNNPNGLESTAPISNGAQLANYLTDIVNIIPATAANFGAIRPYCKSQGYARSISLNHSCMRLASPDKKKYGGGHRVRQISMTDNWSSDVSEESSRTYGQRYEYTIEENGKTISSGVAQYEPQLGGDENPLKYPIHYTDKQNLVTRNNLFAEAPMNESLFPGASVGYRKVTVKSINTDERLKNPSTAKGRTAGLTVHQFYTAKEFPTFVETSILSEENSTKDVFNLPIMIPLVGSIKRNYYHGTQAYLIELNDMHGKLKSVETFELNNYIVNTSPITSTVYEYQCVPRKYQGENVLALDNEVSIIANDGTHTEAAQKRQMGVEYDLFTDQRQAKTFNNDVSLAMNVDVPPFPIPLPSIWLTYNNYKTLFRTYVTNKVVHRSGILKKTKARDLQTVNEQEVMAYDEKSGQPVLMRTKNEFGDDFYSYNIPAYYAYDRMGHAYQNINYKFGATLESISDPKHKTVEFAVNEEQINHLVRGDELLIMSGSSLDDHLKKGYFIGFKYSTDGSGIIKGILHVDQELEDESQEVTLKVIRSGYRNHYDAVAANYLSKGRLDISPTPENITTNSDLSTISTKKITGNVLSATASLFKDDWLAADISENADLKIVDNPFLSGNSGIWRPYKSYSYVVERKQHADFVKENTSVNPDLKNDGVMENVPMFSWEIGDIENYIPNWEWVSEVTKYSSDAYELENVNRLGIYSSALYGYDNSLTIGVGGNSTHPELGAMDFEAHDGNSYGKAMRQTNFNFYNNYESITQFIHTEHYHIRHAKYLGDGLVEAVVNVPYDYYMDAMSREVLLNNAGATLNSTKNHASAGNKGYYFNAQLKRDKHEEVIIGGKSYTKIQFDLLYANPTHGFDLLPDNSEFTGKISLLMDRPVTYGSEMETNAATFNLLKAHTGKVSLKIPGTARYDQLKLKLKKDKKYVVSLWVSRDQTDVRTYKPSSGNLVSVGTVPGGTFTAISGAKYSYGKVVEGWQKIDIEFAVTTDHEVLSLKFEPGASAMYIDDVRFSPKTGGIMTYVYDPAKFWLRASLNADNYATLFFYDEEGNLTIKKQETEKGIFTISESRGHVSEED